MLSLDRVTLEFGFLGCEKFGPKCQVSTKKNLAQKCCSPISGPGGDYPLASLAIPSPVQVQDKTCIDPEHWPLINQIALDR